jgi:S-methyl-5-thioribulose 1-phosphate isomerase
VLWGNSALLPGIRLADFTLPDSLLDVMPGPQFGIQGLREMFDAPSRPLLATALKPMGLSAERLAAFAHDLALGGMDMIKDDHSLANQPFAPFVERVQRCAEAVAEANSKSGYNSVYMPSVNAPYDQLEARVEAAMDAGAGALLVLPGITSFDQMRYLATRVDVPIMGHPAFLGSYSASPTGGVAHGKLYGTMMRLAGADLSVYPNYGGRFSFTRAECRDVATALKEPLGDINPAFPSPGGGMTLARVDEIVEFYGNDVALLIGGDLYRGDDMVATAAGFRAAVSR